MAKMNLYGLTYDEYNSLTSHDNQTLYFIKDKNIVYVRGQAYGGRLEIVDAFPLNGEKNVLYFNRTTMETRNWDGKQYTTIAKGVTSSVTDNSDDSLLPTAKAVTQYVTKKINDIGITSDNIVTNVSSGTNASLSIQKGTKVENIPINDVVYTPTWDSGSRTLTFPIVGKDPLVVTLAKDLVVTAGKYNVDTKEIWLSIDENGAYDDIQKVIKIPVGTLIDIYTGNSTSTVNVVVSDKNVISANVKVSQQKGNALSVKNDGLFVNVPDNKNAMSKVEIGHTDEVLTAQKDGSAKASGKQIGGATLQALPNVNTIATEAAVKAYNDQVKTETLNEAQQQANQAQQNAEAHADGLITWTNW